MKRLMLFVIVCLMSVLMVGSVYAQVIDLEPDTIANALKGMSLERVSGDGTRYYSYDGATYAIKPNDNKLYREVAVASGYDEFASENVYTELHTVTIDPGFWSIEQDYTLDGEYGGAFALDSQKSTGYDILQLSSVRNYQESLASQTKLKKEIQSYNSEISKFESLRDSATEDASKSHYDSQIGSAKFKLNIAQNSLDQYSDYDARIKELALNGITQTSSSQIDARLVEIDSSLAELKSLNSNFGEVPDSIKEYEREKAKLVQAKGILDQTDSASSSVTLSTTTPTTTPTTPTTPTTLVPVDSVPTKLQQAKLDEIQELFGQYPNLEGVIGSGSLPEDVTDNGDGTVSIDGQRYMDDDGTLVPVEKAPSTTGGGAAAPLGSDTGVSGTAAGDRQNLNLVNNRPSGSAGGQSGPSGPSSYAPSSGAGSLGSFTDPRYGQYDKDTIPDGEHRSTGDPNYITQNTERGRTSIHKESGVAFIEKGGTEQSLGKILSVEKFGQSNQETRYQFDFNGDDGKPQTGTVKKGDLYIDGAKVDPNSVIGKNKDGTDVYASDVITSADNYKDQGIYNDQLNYARARVAGSGTNYGFFFDMNQVASTASGWDGLSYLFMSGEQRQEWATNVEEAFKPFSSAGWIENICFAKIDTPPAGTAYVKLPNGLGLDVATTIAGECAEQPPVEGVSENIYKLVGFVENPIATYNELPMRFRLVVKGPSGTTDVLAEKKELVRGERYDLTGPNAFVQISPNKYNEVCVVFDTPPAFYDSNEVCNVIDCRSVGETGYSTAPTSAPVAPVSNTVSANTGTSGGTLAGSQAGNAEYNQI